VATAIARKVRYLSDKLALTQDDVAKIVGSSPRAVGRWSSGEGSPQKLKKERLLELAFIGERLATVLRREDANLWIFSPNVLLDGDTPAERIHKGDYKRVLALIEALADGVVT